MGIDDGGVRSLFVKAECLPEMLCHISPACYVYLYLVCIVHSEKKYFRNIRAAVPFPWFAGD